MFLDDLTDFHIIKKTITCSPTPEYMGEGVNTMLHPFEPYTYTQVKILLPLVGYGLYQESVNEDGTSNHILHLKTGDLLSTDSQENVIELLYFFKNIEDHRKYHFSFLTSDKKYLIYNKHRVVFPNSYFHGLHMSIATCNGRRKIDDIGGDLLPSDFSRAMKIRFIELPSYCNCE